MRIAELLQLVEVMQRLKVAQRARREKKRIVKEIVSTL